MIGETIRRLRLQKKISLSELARQSNLPVTSLYNIEQSVSKNPGWYHICSIADALEIGILDLRALEKKTLQKNQDGKE